MQEIIVNGEKYEFVSHPTPDEKYNAVYFNCNWYVKVEEKPKEWEILSFKFRDKETFCTLRSNGLYLTEADESKKGNYTLEDTLKKEQFKIHSVKRLSDNSIFTVGETTEGNNIIASFKLENNHIRVRMEDEIGRWWTNLASLTKATKQPLFTTVDNVTVYHGDTFFGISKYCDTGEWKDVTKWSADQRNNYEDEYIKTRVFSKKENAEKALKEWQLFNKPLLSLKEVVEYSQGVIYKGGMVYNNLLELAETKIQ